MKHVTDNFLLCDSEDVLGHFKVRHGPSINFLKFPRQLFNFLVVQILVLVQRGQFGVNCEISSFVFPIGHHHLFVHLNYSLGPFFYHLIAISHILPKVRRYLQLNGGYAHLAALWVHGVSVETPEAIETRFDLGPSFEVLEPYLFFFVNFIDLLLKCVA